MYNMEYQGHTIQPPRCGPKAIESLPFTWLGVADEDTLADLYRDAKAAMLPGARGKCVKCGSKVLKSL